MDAANVVLTFDDGYLAHHSVAAPALRDRGFGATFFICSEWRDGDFMSLPQVYDLYDQGFEIGNHSSRHIDHRNQSLEEGLELIQGGERELLHHGIAKPVSFAFPGCPYDDTIIAAAKQQGYLASRGCWGTPQEMTNGESGRGGYHQAGDPLHPMLLTGMFGTNYGLNDFEEDIGRLGGDQTAIFAFHNFTEYMPQHEVSVPETAFLKALDLLAGFNVMSLRQYVTKLYGHPVSTSPHRTPLVASREIGKIMEGHVVCDLGCAEGDNMVEISQYARRVIGLDSHPKRLRHAIARGLDVGLGDYLKADLPSADCYYLWADRPDLDNEPVIARIRSSFPSATVIIGVDCGFPADVEFKKAQSGVEVVDVQYCEGNGERQSGVFSLVIFEP